MTRIFIISLLMVVSLSVKAQKYKTHTVKKGETITSIAKQYLVTPFDIYALNPDAQTNLREDSVLIIPNSKVKNNPIHPDTQELINYKTHKVKRKETLYSLSKKYNISEEEIKKANRHLYSENLRKGERIRIPRFKTITSKTTLSNTLKKYKVKPKEGKWRIAYKFGITVEELEALNPNMNNVIQPGDEINVPNINDDEEKVLEDNYQYYEVLPKEGFYRLKIKTGLTQEELEALNPDLKNSGLKAGMVLKLPKSSDDIIEDNSSQKAANLKQNISNYDTKNIAVMLPFQLNSIDTSAVDETKTKIRDKKLLSLVLDFYSGVLMALDSAKHLGISTHLKVFDTQYSVNEIDNLLKTHTFRDFDAVIGPMQSKSFDNVAYSLNRENIPVIAALNKPNKVYSNVFQTIPNDNLLERKMINFIKNDSTKNNIIIISDRANKSISDKLKLEFPEATQVLSEKKKKTGKDAYFIYPVNLKKVLNPGKTIVFLQTTNNSFASSVISMLNGFNGNNREIILTTLDKNRAFEGKNIDNNHLSNLNFHYPSINKHFENNSIDYGFVKHYKSTYGVYPNKYACRGFDITLDMLLRLSTSTNLLNSEIHTNVTEYTENKFQYKKTSGGYVNQAVYVVKHEDLKIVNAK